MENTYGISGESAQHLYSEVMNMTGRRKNYVRNVLVDAEEVLDEKNILTVNDILLDTGAAHASYIDKDLVCKDRIRAMHAVVDFGANKTSQEINEIAVLPLRMEYQNLTPVTADIEFCVMQMPGRTMIVGLPDLIEHYFYILLEILHTTVKQDGEDYNRNVKILPRVNVLEPVEPICIAKDDELPEWVKQDVEPCVEEEETPDPCSFTGPLNYLSMSRDEALEEYEGLLESHLSRTS
jgi:hypothetical protein